MTVENENNRNDYVGDNTTDTYAFTFKIFDQSHVAVYEQDDQGVETTLAVDVDFTIPSTDIGVDAGGNITLTAGNLATGHKLAIVRDPPLTQTTEIKNQGTFYPETHEDEFDLLVMQIQSLLSAATRALAILETDAGANTTVPVGVSGSVLGWDDNGDLTNIPPSDDTSVTMYENTFNTSMTISRENGKHQKVTMTANITSITWTGFSEGYELIMKFIQGSGAPYTVDWTASGQDPDLYFPDGNPIDMSGAAEDDFYTVVIRMVDGDLLAVRGPDWQVPT